MAEDYGKLILIYTRILRTGSIDLFPRDTTNPPTMIVTPLEYITNWTID